MKTYRAGTIEYVYTSAYCIQEKKWYGWRTLTTYSDKEKWQSAVNELKSKGHIVL